MSMTDPVADLLTRIRNAAKEKHEKLEIPASRLKANIVRVLKEEGYIKNFRLMREEGRPVIKVYLKYTDEGNSVIQGVRRVSRPGLRRYSGYEEMPRPLGGAGIAIVSTSKGVITGHRARTQKLGGEILCEVW
ncbi:MAG TPA: 30S ribosomal protein S8 [Bdellovibrionales bacterium]|nr:MAG: 30S ribosomal protein S8 [Bdellovibrionales bacterium GWB1_52_6]OFZ02611.1 MAG: 30S ribosomal protein S8 [Bdellovibrionales bacterium GWA1_52_35]OFZ41804.1 MAG: 30S ribosomal protein S8 [Bdellovibrionales bacterium GWC1_52_8]HAR43849.1 30S ribosomal protein S8 [Bdellovibrionales bacterium]HCM41468.1 30S ribosomal protein S8 [Bdellovibrionales bacterium]